MNTTKVSAFQMGYIGIRAEKKGRAAKLVEKIGGWKSSPASINNRNAFDFVLPIKTRDEFHAFDFRALADSGLVGVAIWFCDAQWANNAGITDSQWQSRAIIDAQFCAQWPTGRRS